MTIDSSTPFGQRVQRKLAEAEIIWLVTVSDDGTPQPSPVWFLWENDTLLIYSKPDAPKLRNIAARPRIALHFDTDPHGDEVEVLIGRAALDPQAPLASDIPAYLDKYGHRIPQIGMDPVGFAQAYSAAFRVTVEKVRGY
ncbi:MAG TPA: TIGR03667 family PPOX class F420-dependent oxidoreductase [Roseiflexaceae bacterium]|nr:TIGR03667 family PPOX class F420-dependent oxidoreductase [Roseiflexaceae bacterium]